MTAVVATICEETRFENPVQITVATTAREIPGWDSLAHVRIVLGIEMELEIEVPIDLTYSTESVGELVQLVESVVAAG